MKRIIPIRKFENYDAKAVSQLIIDDLTLVNSRDYGEAAAHQMAQFYTPEFILQFAQNENIFVALEGAEIVGTAALDGNRIRNVFVRGDHHKQGIGKLLMNLIEEAACLEGKTRLFLQANVTAVEFYQKLGYTQVEEKIERIGDALVKTIVMEKILSAG